MKKSYLKPTQQHVHWEIQEAKAKFPKLIDDAIAKGYQIITNQGEPVAVMISVKEFETITHPKTSLLEFFKSSPHPEVEIEFKRSKEHLKNIDL